MTRGLGDYHLKITSERKKKFLELLGTSKTMDISIEIEDDLKNSTTGENDNGELESSLFQTLVFCYQNCPDLL